MTQPTIRLSLSSKGRLEGDTLDFLAESGLHVFRLNPRQYFLTKKQSPYLGGVYCFLTS